MESSKPKKKAKTTTTSKKPAATPKAGKAVKTVKAKAVKSQPGENEIRLKAQELYNERIFRGEQGSPEQDWLNAERLLTK